MPIFLARGRESASALGTTVKEEEFWRTLRWTICCNSGRKGTYGLGVHLTGKPIAHGVKAYGHGGGNIGTSTYMAYLPDLDVSIAVSINSHHKECPDRILEDIIEIVNGHVNHIRQQ
jgi:hypothetical protein